jgi:predicted Rossmann fold nucleotide-binding protein DprA/Smf involved in DNA uptake
MISSPTQDTQAVLLLCAKLGQQYDVAKPLTTRQYSLLAKWLQERSLRPRDLLQDNGRTQLSELQLSEVGRDQVERLLDRGAALGVMVERWTGRGVWLISRGDEEYPVRYKTYLLHRAPPIIYGVGEQSSLQNGGLAVVGSRDASEEDLSFAQRVGAACADQRIAVISGTAKGIDSESMMAAIHQTGIAIGVLADGLGRAAVATPYHEAILDGRLTLISPYEPESPWQTFAAMDRNKLIYALADAALVVASADGQGGTWAGAVEALKQKQIPLYVKASGVIPVANRKLIQSGAQEFPPEPWNNLRQLFENSSPPSTLLFGDHSQSYPSASNGGSVPEQLEGAPDSPESASVPPKLELAANQDRNGSDAYGHIVGVILEILAEPMDEHSIAERLNVLPSRAKSWLKRAVQEGRVRKLKKRPVEYVRTSSPLSLFAHKSEAVPKRGPKREKARLR